MNYSNFSPVTRQEVVTINQATSIIKPKLKYYQRISCLESSNFRLSLHLEDENGQRGGSSVYFLLLLVAVSLLFLVVVLLVAILDVGQGILNLRVIWVDTW